MITPVRLVCMVVGPELVEHFVIAPALGSSLCLSLTNKIAPVTTLLGF